jgi:hypothetical protein
MSKTVWILNHYAYAPDQSAGTRHYELARQIAKEGGKASVISCSFYHKTHTWRHGAKWRIINKENVGGVDYIWVWGWPYRRNGLGRILNLLSFAFLSVAYVLYKGKKGDVLFASSPQPFAAFLSFVFSGNRFCKIFEIRDFWPQIFIDIGVMDPCSGLAKLFFKIERYLISKADIFVSNLSGAERYCKKNKIRYKNFLWIPNGVRSRYDVGSIAPVSLDGIRENIKIMYAGTHGEAQNLYQVINAANTLKEEFNVEFHFLGDGVEKKRIQSYSYENDIKNVYFYDSVSTEEVKKYIVAADALLLPLVDAKIFEYGISPNKLPEYLASGKPIIFFGPRKASPFIDGSEAIVSTGTDSSDLVVAVKRYLIMNESEKKIMKEGSGRLLESKFFWDRSMRDVVKKMLREASAR